MELLGPNAVRATATSLYVEIQSVEYGSACQWSEAAKVLDVRRATLSDLINGNAALSAEMALRIEKAFGVKMETLLNMQAWHDAYAMRQREGEIDVKRYRSPAPEPR